MTNNERKLLVMLADCMIKQASALEADMIFELRNGVVDNANNSAEALAKEIGTEIAATTVGSKLLNLRDSVAIICPKIPNGNFIIDASNSAGRTRAILTYKQMQQLNERITRYFESVDNKR